MYGQRRGLSQGHNVSDFEARDTNASLMQTKRRQILLAQLSDKEELYKQYTNPRGIGMRGQTVPQRDIDILHQQIEGIRQQIAALDGNVQPSTNVNASATAPQSAYQPQSAGGFQGNNPPQTQQPQPSSAYQQQEHHGSSGSGGGGPIAFQSAFPAQSSRAVGGGGGSSGRSLRDQAWNTKYQRWLAKNQHQQNQYQQQSYSTAPSQPQQMMMNSQMNSAGNYSGAAHQSGQASGIPPLHPQTNSNMPPQQRGANPQHQQNQSYGFNNNNSGGGAPYQQQQPQQPQFGRRATPPNSNEFNQQRQPTPTNGMGMGPSDHQTSTYGRRGSGRPW